jgi:hypothetical protein
MPLTFFPGCSNYTTLATKEKVLRLALLQLLIINRQARKGKGGTGGTRDLSRIKPAASAAGRLFLGSGGKYAHPFSFYSRNFDTQYRTYIRISFML